MRTECHGASRASAQQTNLDETVIDQATIYLCQTTEYPPLAPEAEREMVRKIDWILVPMLFLTATLSAVDKVALGTSALCGLREGLGLEGQEYAWAGSILPIGGIVGMWPSSYLVQRFPSAKYLCVCSMGWSMALLIPISKSSRGLLAPRVFMEAVIVPGISLIIAGFYKKNEQPSRNALVFAAASSVINEFLSWAAGHIPDSAPLAKWQSLFVITGSLSIPWSVFAFVTMPDSPMNAFFLSEQEKYHAVQRLAENKTVIVKHWNQRSERRPDHIRGDHYQEPRVFSSGQFTPEHANGRDVHAASLRILNAGRLVVQPQLSGNLIGPQTFRNSQAPEYTIGFIAMLVSYCVSIALMAGYWALAILSNKRSRENTECEDDELIASFQDKTDFQQKNFKYTS
ncbi:hypothetical protein ACJ73_01216 [Blastomyces percursus]|uniref:Major facilitator superfamily (MFS) profile domain-containing protein n=1 Tax=Blastomyces percursus TaxID=1658174 RepID=A0A1J9R4V7_9EURO|nr:hypothetical protein ACJ73_01216 [Blastomyces percursus]